MVSRVKVLVLRVGLLQCDCLRGQGEYWGRATGVGLSECSRVSELSQSCRRMTLLQSGGVCLPRHEVYVSQRFKLDLLLGSVNELLSIKDTNN